jgi:hypothetical protein
MRTVIPQNPPFEKSIQRELTREGIIFSISIIHFETLIRSVFLHSCFTLAALFFFVSGSYTRGLLFDVLSMFNIARIVSIWMLMRSL